MSSLAASLIASERPRAGGHVGRERTAVRSCLSVLRDPSALDMDELVRDSINAQALDLVDSYLPRRTNLALYQYRDLDGFAGIVGSGNLWATHSGFLNDPTEVRYCESILQQSVDYFAAGAPDCVAAFVRAYVADILRDARQLNVYFTCLTEAEDLLSQWMTYTPGACGVALGFDGGALSALPFVTLRRVMYDRRQQFRMLRNLLRTYLEPLRAAFETTDQTRLTTLGVTLGLLIHQAMLCFKNSAFAQEREWRLIVVFAQGTPFEKCVRYRVSGRTLVPYVEIPLAAPGEPLPITDVILGPGLDFELNGISVGRFLKAHDIAIAPRASKVPFRTMR